MDNPRRFGPGEFLKEHASFSEREQKSSKSSISELRTLKLAPESPPDSHGEDLRVNCLDINPNNGERLIVSQKHSSRPSEKHAQATSATALLKLTVRHALSALIVTVLVDFAMKFSCFDKAFVPSIFEDYIPNMWSCASSTADANSFSPPFTYGTYPVTTPRHSVCFDGRLQGSPDYASYAMGARPIQAMISASYAFPERADIAFMRRIFSSRGVVPQPPAVLLSESVEPGKCWPMAGSSGYIGIKLSYTIFVTNVTVDHVPTTSLRDVRTAPRSLLLWGLAQDESVKREALDVELFQSLPATLKETSLRDTPSFCWAVCSMML
ncbi:hypothetical protein SCP_1603330 [Sparassis crispa]|uniref:SUN domain-containing protein n=1 Tax=Sparassis crispa TaxID=139825 RepID=A0A401H5L4_9APHY|nr:hypothetical protein SCP_1603330 [Sparassis crispa]GBE89669.1 hypothetical protein SCP_1603330 [Sparassis crispa]